MVARRTKLGVTVRIPASLRALTGGSRLVRVSGHTVGEVLSALEDRHPGLRARLRGESGQLRGHILVFLNSEDIHTQAGESTTVQEGDDLVILPALEGG